MCGITLFVIVLFCSVCNCSVLFLFTTSFFSVFYFHFSFFYSILSCLGGPDVPPITKREQGEMIYDVLNIPKEKRTFVSIPLGVFNILISAFLNLESLAGVLNLKSLKDKFEDAAEVTRIVRYYASEPMVALGKGEVQGKMKLRYVILDPEVEVEQERDVERERMRMSEKCRDWDKMR